MTAAAIGKILLLAVGGLTVLNYVPGVSVFGGDEKSDYKKLVRCEAKYEGLSRKHKETKEDLKSEQNENKRLVAELKDEQKERQKTEKALKEYISNSVRYSRTHERYSRDRDRLRGDEDRESGRRSIFPWRR